MNATKLYAQLSRKVMMLNNGVFLSEFIRNDMTLLKLRSLLLCKSCKEICEEPFSSEFCQHLTCEVCLREKRLRYACCKWCRNPDDLSADFQSKILIASYRKLCAILRDFVTGYMNSSPGLNVDLKSKLLQTLEEGCMSPFIPPSGLETSQEKPIKEEETIKSTATSTKSTQADIFCEIREKSPVCPPCCCRCPTFNGDIHGHDKSPLVEVDGEKLTQGGVPSVEKKCDYSLDYRSDTVSSTVPDTLPVINKALPVENANSQQKDSSDRDSTNEIESLVKSEPNSKIDNDTNLDVVVKEPPVTSCQFYDALTTISMKERENRSIFEKFGLALSPTNKIENEPPRTNKIEKHRIKLTKSKDKLTYTCEIKPKLQPLKLKVRKVNSYDNDGFSVQYNISNSNENSDKEVDRTQVENFTIRKTTELKTSEDCNSYSDVTGSDTQEPEERKVKRKATFINNYMSAFSDDSDFESDSAFNKRQLKTATKRDLKNEACSCGSGSHVKYFTNICKRTRCPCFSQGKSCATCKCRFCSNPYSDNQVDDMFTDSESENEQPQLTYEQPPLTYWLKEESDVVDVESV